MILAQITDYSSLLQLGVAGVMLAWFMFRLEKKMDAHTQVISDLAQSILLDVLSRDSLSDSTRRNAHDLMERVRNHTNRQRERV